MKEKGRMKGDAEGGRKVNKEEKGECDGEEER